MARVLLAEDDDFAAMVVGALLKKQGVKHELASSGEDCITRWDETASTDPYDVVRTATRATLAQKESWHVARDGGHTVCALGVLLVLHARR